MPRKTVIGPVSEKKQKQYERTARLQYGPDVVNASIKLWNSYPKDKQDAILEEAGQIYGDMVEVMEAGISSQDSQVQSIVQRWHENLRYFYEPTLEILRGLGEGYRTDPDFNAFFQKLHPELPDYLSEAISQYVNDLEYAEIEQLLADDDLKGRSSRLSG